MAPCWQDGPEADLSARSDALHNLLLKQTSGLLLCLCSKLILFERSENICLFNKLILLPQQESWSGRFLGRKGYALILGILWSETSPRMSKSNPFCCAKSLFLITVELKGAEPIHIMLSRDRVTIIISCINAAVTFKIRPQRQLVAEV